MALIKVWTGGVEADHLNELLRHLPIQYVPEADSADYLLYPRCISTEMFDSGLTAVRPFHDLAEQLGKYLLLFFVSDIVVPVLGMNRALIFRTSLQRSRQLTNERILPYVWGDMRQAPFPPVRNDKPKVGFCGAITHPDRAVLLEVLRKVCAPQVDCDFIIREATWGSGIETAVQDFWNNMERCEFIACGRGCGNFSIRLYQTLSAGRIPILVDTDVVLPFADEIPWLEISLFVHDLRLLPERLHGFLQRKNLAEVQSLCRRYYEEYLSVQGYATHFTHWMRSGRF